MPHSAAAAAAMLTEVLYTGVDFDRWLQSAQVELVLREAFELKFQAALAARPAPVKSRLSCSRTKYAPIILEREVILV